MLTVGSDVERYRVEAILGRGGAGTVYAVRHQTLGTMHALKVLHIASPTMRARFLEEGRIQARLRHPNLVPVSDVLDLHGHPGLLMDHVGGGSLADRLLEAPVTLHEGLCWAVDVVKGVGHAHKLGVTHRDLKPANVLLTRPEDGARVVARVTDFGLARVLGGQHPSLTQMGAMLGTPAYMAPEQARDPRGVDARADLFSLGVVLYEIFTGRRPFSAPSHAEVLALSQAGRFVPAEQHVPALPPALATLISHCLAPDREDRPDDCSVLLSVLEATQADADPAGPPLWAHAEPVPATLGEEAPSGAQGAEPPTTLASFFAPFGDEAAESYAAASAAGAAAEDAASSEPSSATAPGVPLAEPAVTLSEHLTPQPAPSPAPQPAPHTPDPEAAPGAAPASASRPVGRLPRRAVALAVPLALAGLGFGEAAEARVAWWLQATLAAPIESSDVALVGIAEPKPSTLRPEYAGLLRSLRDHGVKGVVFDLALTEETEHDAGIAAAIAELAADGVPVAVPLRYTTDGPRPPGSDAVARAATLGLVEWVRSSSVGQVHKLDVLRTAPDGAPVWHLAVHGAAMAAGVAPEDLALEESTLHLGTHTAPAPHHQLWLAPTLPPPHVSLREPERFHELEDRVAFVGVYGSDLDQVRTPGGHRYGVETLAMLAQALVADRVPRPLGAGWSVLAAGMAGVASLLAGRTHPQAGWAVAALAVVACAGAVATGYLVALIPVVLAAALGAWSAQSGGTP